MSQQQLFVNDRKVAPQGATEHRPPTERSTSDMIDDCFRHQHPEAYGRPQVGQVAIPWKLGCGRDHMVTSATSAIPEEQIGNPNAIPLDANRP